TDGNVSNPPPLAPPPFTESAWHDQIPLFEDPQALRLSSDWGWRTLDGTRDFHGGIDIAGPVGRDVISPVSGRVLEVFDESWKRTGVYIVSGDKIYQFWHIIPGVTKGELVNRG